MKRITLQQPGTGSLASGKADEQILVVIAVDCLSWQKMAAKLF